jgi:hypothetical protein
MRVFAFLQFVFLLIAFQSTAQIIIEESDDNLYEEKTFGPNRKHYVFSYLSYMVPAAPSAGPGTPVSTFSSTYFDFGICYKRKIGHYYSLLGEVVYYTENYSINQDSMKTFASSNLYDSENLSLMNFSFRFLNRFNFDKRRGNHLGFYLDLGAYYDLVTLSQHSTETKLADKSKVKVTHSRLPYVNPFSYGVMGAVGYRGISLVARYRLTQIFKPNYLVDGIPYYEPSQLWVGLRFNLN